MGQTGRWMDGRQTITVCLLLGAASINIGMSGMDRSLKIIRIITI